MRYAAFFRNIMVGRHGLTRDVLLAAFERSGAAGAESFLATGNVIFESDARSVARVAAGVAAHLLSAVGLREPIFVRSLHALAALASAEPFAAAPTDDIHERCVTFLPDGSPAVDGLPFRSPRRDFEVFAATAAEVFSVTRQVGGRPGQPGKWVEQRTGLRVTTRNWNTVERILKRYG